jgi:ceramide glucosyltransferase
MLAFLYIGFAILAVLSIGVSFVLTGHAWEHFRYARGSFRVDRTPCFLGRIGLIVPCKGADFALKENLSCLFSQDYEDYEIYFVVESADDPACGIIRKILSSQSHIPAYLIVAGETTHGGQKIHNLLCGYRALTPETRLAHPVNDPPSASERTCRYQLPLVCTSAEWFCQLFAFQY